MRSEPSKKIIILFDIAGQIRDSNIPLKTVLQLFVLFKIFRTKGWSITLNDASDIEIGDLFKGTFLEIKELQNCITHKKWKQISFEEYSYLIIDTNLEATFWKYLQTSNHFQVDHDVKTRIYLMEGGDRQRVAAFGKISDLLRGGGFGTDAAIRQVVEPVKHAIRESFDGLTEAFYVNKFKHLLNKIKEANQSGEDRIISRVLVLDDYTFNFFIGDFCLWIADYQRRVVQIFKYSIIHINCTNQTIFEKLVDLFGNSFGERIMIQNQRWDEIIFEQYDLVICQDDRVFKLLLLFDSRSGKIPAGMRVYYFTPIYYRDSIAQVFKEHNYWSYDSFFQHAKSKIDKKILFSNLLQNKDKEINVSQSEQNWADDWFEAQGVMVCESVVVLPYSASTSIKLLIAGEFALLAAWLIGTAKMKVLIFNDSSFEEISADFTAALGEQMDSVITVPIVDLRTTTRLLSSKYISGVIGPCTGLLHLANGVFLFLRNNKIRQQIPFLIVYTGDFSEFEERYHPINWWLHTLAKVVVACKNENEQNGLLPLGQCPRSSEQYKKMTLPVSVIKAQWLIDYLTTSKTIKFIKKLNALKLPLT
jgi:hypothetical protein